MAHAQRHSLAPGESCVSMDAVSLVQLQRRRSWRELKEKLALLKREYSKTFHRLQRAERAEKVNNYVKKTVAEKNLLLMQEEAEGDLADGGCSKKSAAKAASVTFKPEAFNQEDSLLGNLSSSCSNQDRKRVLFSPVLKKNQNSLSRSRTKVQQRASLALEEREESTWDAPLGNVGPQPESSQGSKSPVFNRSDSLWMDHSIPEASSGNAAEEGRGSDVSPVLLHLDCLQETSGQATFLHDLSRENQESSPEHLCEEGLFDSSGGSAVKNIVSPADMQIESPQMEKEAGRFAGLAVTIEAASHTHGMQQEGSRCQEPQKLELSGGDAPTSKPSGNGLGDQLEETGTPLLDRAPATPAKDVLSSCTVVEGLLFPVEYYVRTTRRMSSQQREVNLEAVIQTQLGKSRKGQRIVCKEKSTDPASSSSQGQTESGEQREAVPFPFPDSGASPGTSPLQSLSNENTSSSGDLVQSEGLVQPRRKRRLRGRSNHKALSATAEDPAENVELTIPKVDSSLVPSEAQGRKENHHGRDKATVLYITAGGSVESKPSGRKWPAESAVSASTHPETELETVHVSQVVNSKASVPSSFMGSLEENDKTCCPDSGSPEQAGNWNNAGVNLAQVDRDPLPHYAPLVASVKCKRRGAPRGRRRASLPVESQDPTSLYLFGTGSPKLSLPFHGKRSKMSSLKWLPCGLELQEFHLPEDEFGLLKLEKLKACAVNLPETFDTGQSAKCLQDTSGAGFEKDSALRENPISLEKEPPFPVGSPRKALPSTELFLSLALEGVPESQLPTPVFPRLGATPASQALPGTPGASALQAHASPEPGDSAGISALPRSRQEEEEGGGERMPSLSQGQREKSWKPDEDVASFEERLLSASESVECYKESPKQEERAEEPMNEVTVEDLAEDSQRKGTLRMTSKLKSCSGSCSVDVGTVWWEAADFTALCVVTACEASISLWRHLESGHWGCVHTWHFTKVPVIQIVPLPGVQSLVCVALGGLEISEIRFLFYSSEDGCVKQPLIKTGNINAVLGLKNRRLVSSCGSLQDQEVEVLSFSETGRSKERQALMPPEETVLAFAEVDGMEEALIALTTTDCLVVWNLTTGQLLRKVPLGSSYPGSVCHKAYSDSGLLFIVLSHPHAKESNSWVNPAFQVVVLNPKTARSARLMSLSLPLGITGRYLEGEVKGASAAAVLTSGTIAVWDLFWGQCTALLPPNSEGSWSLARWSVTDTCLLAGQKDGSVYIYSYTTALRDSLG
ncbi:partner and localizer of BRCA2 isoform X2 [Podarcis raffonei]|uniref:partner and localizer of BRCA2 isoform X2 n=1 Tax=Podarcis raffonei TaxID=65483 RepID=UPI0023296A67|nr:partner and localizer of BRCA2 isoform X2 [Podarcis raffonei]